MVGRRTAFRRFNDNAAERLESGSQVLLGLIGAALGVLLVLWSDRHGLLRWGWLVLAGAAWAGFSLWRLLRTAGRVRALRHAVPAVATVVAARPTGSYADEWYQRRYVDVRLLVTLPGAAPRTLHERAALTEAQLAELVPGAAVPVRVHPSRPIVQLQWAPDPR